MRKAFSFNFVFLFSFVLLFSLIFSGCSRHKLDNPNLGISFFIPENLNGIKYDKTESYNNSQGGFTQKGLLFFSVGDNKINNNSDNYSNNNSQQKQIIINVFLCNRNDCTNILNQGVLKSNKGISNEDKQISGKSIMHYYFNDNVNNSVINNDSAIYIWCDRIYCFQLLSYSEFQNQSEYLVEKIILKYQ